jgi:hypothetical protein
MDGSCQIRLNYSSSVDLHLEAEGGRWPLAKTSREHIVPATRFDLPVCDGVIVVNIDGKEHRSDVRLINGVCFFDGRVKIERKTGR